MHVTLGIDLYPFAQIGNMIGHRPIPDGTKGVQAKQVHRTEPPATGRTLRLLHPVLRDAPELRPGLL